MPFMFGIRLVCFTLLSGSHIGEAYKGEEMVCEGKKELTMTPRPVKSLNRLEGRK